MDKTYSPIHSWRDKRYLRFYEIVDLIVDELQDARPEKGGKAVKRKSRGARFESLTYSVEKIIRDCVAVVFQRKRIQAASIAKSYSHYPADRDDKRLSYKITVKRAYEGMIALGYIEEVKKGFFDRTFSIGRPSKSALTRYEATSKLIDLFSEQEQKCLPALLPPKIVPELIIARRRVETAKGSKRERLSFRETEETTQMRENLKKINRVLSEHWYDLELDDEEHQYFLKQMVSKEAQDNGRKYNLDLRQIHLYRVFNDEKLQTGGRFYGGWWQQISRDYRRKLIVGGKRMIEYDYSNMHPAMLYHLEGLMPPEDTYTKVIAEYFPEHENNREPLRRTIKQAFNAMVNSPKILKSPPRGVRLKQYGINWKQMSEAIIESNKPIQKYFYSGYGTRLQRFDSDIAELVLLHFADMSYPVLPVHDSFLAHNGFENELNEVMALAYRKKIGYNINVNLKQVKTADHCSEENYDFGEPTTDDLDELLKAMDVGHENRLQAFRRNKYT